MESVPIRKILAPVRGDGKIDTVLGHAAALAKRSGAHLEVAHCRARAQDLMPYGVPLPRFVADQLKEQARQLADTEEGALKERFDANCAAYGLTEVEKQTMELGTASWVEEEGRMVDVVKRHGRLSDLIAVAKPDRDRNIGTNTLMAALFHTARPVMMCPPSENPPKELGRSVSIAWNGSLEAVRAVVMMRRVIEAAEDVTILTNGKEAAGASADDYLDYLRLRGMDAKIHRFTDTGNVGAALLRESATVGADVMIMGAYGQSHEREIVFGGNTQTIVDRAERPVILVH